MLPAAVFLQHIVFRAGMHHDLRRPLWQMRDEVQELTLADSLARDDAGKMVRRQETAAVRLAVGEACKRAEAQAPDELPEPAERTGKEWRARRAHGPDARTGCEVQDDVDDARQRVHVLMTVHMREGDARRFDLLELRGRRDVRLVVNRVSPRMFSRMELTVDDIMDNVGLPLLGLVPEDPKVVLAAAQGVALIFAAEDGAAEACLRISRRLRGDYVPLMKL